MVSYIVSFLLYWCLACAFTIFLGLATELYYAYHNPDYVTWLVEDAEKRVTAGKKKVSNLWLLAMLIFWPMIMFQMIQAWRNGMTFAYWTANKDKENK